MPPKRSTSSRISRTTSSKRNFDRSGPSFSPIGVESATSAISTETIRRSPVATDMRRVIRRALAGHATPPNTAQAVWTDEAPRDPPRHVHHGRRAAERRVLRGHARAAPRQEVGQPGRPDGLPPVLRRRARFSRRRHHLLRVPRRGAGARGERDDPPDRLPRRRRGGARFLGAPSRRRAQRPLVARHPEIPEEHAIRGFSGVRAYAAAPGASATLLTGLGFDGSGREWEARGDRVGFYVYAEPPAERGVPGAGTVHHVAWATPLDEHEAWVERVREAGGRPTPVIDRFWFRSIYFREPSGVLFEIASNGPGFATDED